MRYDSVEEIEFTNIYGKTKTLKGMREYEEMTTAISLKINENTKLDELASRPEVYGEEAEYESYKIMEHNIVTLVDNDFNLEKIDRLNIPL